MVQPLELNTNRIFVRIKDDVAKYVNHAEPTILSDACAPLYARQLALHANVSNTMMISNLLLFISPVLVIVISLLCPLISWLHWLLSR